MQALKLPAARGWQWLVLGYALFRRQPALIGLMAMSYWMVLLVLNALPLIGPIAAILLTPGLSAGVMPPGLLITTGAPESSRKRPSASVAPPGSRYDQITASAAAAASSCAGSGSATTAICTDSRPM